MSDRLELLRLKAHCLATGIRLDPQAGDQLSRSGTVPLTVHEYATTGGMTFRIGDVFVNAPFDDWFSDRSRAELALAPSGGFEVRFDGVEYPCEVLPLPGYLDRANRFGQPVVATTMSHGDRIRVSPISGCTLDCGFCDFPHLRYQRKYATEILASIDVARHDAQLPVHHLLISGGSPGPSHFGWFDDTLTEIISNSGLPTDVMMSARSGSADHVRRYADAGVWGFSLNIEIFSSAAALEIMPRKHRTARPHLARTIEAAVDAVGSHGRVRSMVLIGLEPAADTLAAVEFLADLGCEPVLSPFRPARDTALATWEPPDEQLLLDVYERADQLVRDRGLRLGPRCIPCQHNTLVIPDGSADYWYAADHLADRVEVGPASSAG